MADMSDRDTSMRSGGGLNSAGNRASGAGPGASSNRSTTGGGYGGTSSSSSGSSKSSGGGSGGGLNSAGNRASGAGPGASSNRSTTGGGFGGTGNANGGGSGMGGQVGGGLNSAGNRASGAGPGASSNRSTTGGGFGSSPSLGGGMTGGLNAAGNRASGAGPGASANTTTTGNGFGAPTASERRADLAQQARASELTSMKDLAREQALGTISKAEVGIKDPYNTLSGGLLANVTNMTVRDAIAYAKTAWDGKLANVLGAYQVKDTTLEAVAEKMGLLDAKMTPAVQDQIAVGLMQERANKATVNGRIDVDKFARELSKEWASLATTTGQSYYNANGVDKASVPYSKVHDIAESLVANGVVTAGKSASSITSKDVSSYQTTAPGVSRFSSTYMGDRAATNQQATKAQQNDPSGLPPGTYRGYDPSGLPAETPAVGPVPTTRPERPRSLGQKVAAGAIDVGLGMLPGVGTAVSVINGGLALTGNKTLGERAVDSFVNGEGGAGPDSGRDRQGGSGQIVDNSKSTVPKSQESFEDRYIKYVDPTPRPTPGQRWNYDTSGYA